MTSPSSSSSPPSTPPAIPPSHAHVNSTSTTRNLAIRSQRQKLRSTRRSSRSRSRSKSVIRNESGEGREEGNAINCSGSPSCAPDVDGSIGNQNNDHGSNNDTNYNDSGKQNRVDVAVDGGEYHTECDKHDDDTKPNQNETFKNIQQENDRANDDQFAESNELCIGSMSEGDENNTMNMIPSIQSSTQEQFHDSSKMDSQLSFDTRNSDLSYDTRNILVDAPLLLPPEEICNDVEKSDSNDINDNIDGTSKTGLEDGRQHLDSSPHKPDDEGNQEEMMQELNKMYEQQSLLDDHSHDEGTESNNVTQEERISLYNTYVADSDSEDGREDVDGKIIDVEDKEDGDIEECESDEEDISAFQSYACLDDDNYNDDDDIHSHCDMEAATNDDKNDQSDTNNKSDEKVLPKELSGDNVAEEFFADFQGQSNSEWNEFVGNFDIQPKQNAQSSKDYVDTSEFSTSLAEPEASIVSDRNSDRMTDSSAGADFYFTLNSNLKASLSSILKRNSLEDILPSPPPPPPPPPPTPPPSLPPQQERKASPLLPPSTERTRQRVTTKQIAHQSPRPSTQNSSPKVDFPPVQTPVIDDSTVKGIIEVQKAVNLDSNRASLPTTTTKDESRMNDEATSSTQRINITARQHSNVDGIPSFNESCNDTLSNTRPSLKSPVTTSDTAEIETPDSSYDKRHLLKEVGDKIMVRKSGNEIDSSELAQHYDTCALEQNKSEVKLNTSREPSTETNHVESEIVSPLPVKQPLQEYHVEGDQTDVLNILAPNPSVNGDGDTNMTYPQTNSNVKVYDAPYFDEQSDLALGRVVTADDLGCITPALHNIERKNICSTTKRSNKNNKPKSLDLLKDCSATLSSLYCIPPDDSPSPFETTLWQEPDVLRVILSFVGDPVVVCTMKRVNRFCNRIISENEYNLMKDAARVGGIDKYMRPRFWLWITLEKCQKLTDRSGSFCQQQETPTANDSLQLDNFNVLEKRGRESKWHHIISRDVPRAFGNMPPHKTKSSHRKSRSLVRALISWGNKKMLLKGEQHESATYRFTNPPSQNQSGKEKAIRRLSIPSPSPKFSFDSSVSDVNLDRVDTVSDWSGVSPVSSTVSSSAQNGQKSESIYGSFSKDFVLSSKGMTSEAKVDLQRKLEAVLDAIAGAHECVGYCQGMDYVVAHLLRNLQATLAHLLQIGRLPESIQSARKLHSALEEEDVIEEAVFRVMHSLLTTYNVQHMYFPELRCLKTCCRMFERIIEKKLPVLADHFDYHELHVGMFALSWFQTLFLYIPSMPAPTINHMWDIWLVERSMKIFFRVGTAILFLCQPILLNHDFEGMMQYLNTFPDSSIFSPDILINCALQIKITNQMLEDIEEVVIEANEAAHGM